MRLNSSGSSLSNAKLIIGINLAVFLLEQVVAMDRLFGLSWAGLQRGFLWQLITYQFLHWNLLHLLVNLFGLWFAARSLEPLLGGRRFLMLYLGSGVVGGLLQILLVPDSLLIGASGAVCGLIATFAALFPELRITALVFFVLPVRLQAKWLGYAIVALSTVFLLTGFAPGIGNAAHLGGAIAGYAFVWWTRRTHSVRV
ncbi:MAG: rhomboid family intramembrane serine protease [Terrimicrobiaceae bacterium]|nr:rhomboid family intramembrane serine protease [Terrimicrobiaceae bacterium]